MIFVICTYIVIALPEEDGLPQLSLVLLKVQPPRSPKHLMEFFVPLPQWVH